MLRTISYSELSILIFAFVNLSWGRWALTSTTRSSRTCFSFVRVRYVLPSTAASWLSGGGGGEWWEGERRVAMGGGNVGIHYANQNKCWLRSENRLFPLAPSTGPANYLDVWMEQKERVEWMDEWAKSQINCRKSTRSVSRFLARLLRSNVWFRAVTGSATPFTHFCHVLRRLWSKECGCKHLFQTRNQLVLWLSNSDPIHPHSGPFGLTNQVSFSVFSRRQISMHCRLVKMMWQLNS